MPDEMNEPNEQEPKILREKRWRRAIWLAILAVAACGLGFISFSLVRVHTDSIRLACITSLLQIHAAKCSWALDHKRTYSAQPLASELYGPDKYIREEPTCPDGGTYTLGTVGTKPRCSIQGHTL